jgi:hypothetical protein
MKGITMLEGLTPPKKELACKVRTLLESLEAKDKQILEAALTNDDWPTFTLATELRKRGMTISEHPIRKHRAGGCSCA